MMKRLFKVFWVAMMLCLPAAFIHTTALAEEESAEETYQGGSIPVLKITFHDDVDPDTGEVILSGDEKINLMNESIKHEYRAEGVSMSLIVPETYDNPESDILDGVSGYTGEKELELEFIRGRGNSTWANDKKPYKFKLDKKTNLFGLGKNKHWTLLANANDRSLIIDRIVGYIGDRMGMPYTPRCVPVDLFMNDRYCGSYVLAEEVRVDDNRVEIDEVDENAADPDSADITGDYLFGMMYKFNSSDGERFKTSRGTIFSYDTPSYELEEGEELTDAQKAQQEYLKSFLDRVEDAIYGENFTNELGENVWELMDMHSLADYWMVQEFTCNPDAFYTPSTYLYKLKDTVNEDGSITHGKLYWGPLWDFDFVWGAIQTSGFMNTEIPWVNELRQDDAFVKEIENSWRKLDGVIDELTREGGIMDQYIKEMDESWSADRRRWPEPKDDYRYEDPQSCAEGVNALRVAFDERREWINSNLDKIRTIYHKLKFMDGEEVIEILNVHDGSTGRAVSMPEEKDGSFFMGWYTKDHVKYEEDKEVFEDAIYYAEYADPSTLSHATELFFDVPEKWISWGDAASYDLFPAEAIDKRIEWSSSDESVLTIGNTGYMWVTDGALDGRDRADVYITARLVGCGKEFMQHIVVFDDEKITLPAPERLIFDNNIALKTGEYRKLEYVMEPKINTLNKFCDLSFASTNEDIVTVSGYGVIEGISPGTAKIIVEKYVYREETEQDELLFHYEITVNVAEKEEETEPDTQEETKPDTQDESESDTQDESEPSSQGQTKPESETDAGTKPSDGSSGGSTPSPATGDDTNGCIWFVMLIVSGVCMINSIKRRKIKVS